MLVLNGFAVDEGAHLDLRIKNGDTALDLALKGNKLRVATLLKNASN